MAYIKNRFDQKFYLYPITTKFKLSEELKFKVDFRKVTVKVRWRNVDLRFYNYTVALARSTFFNSKISSYDNQ